MTLANRRVSDVMRTEVVTLTAEEHLDLAEDLMRLGRVRHMPVVEGERLVGIVSSRDLLASSLTRSLEFEPTHRRAFLRSVSVREAMTPDPVTVGRDTSLADAARAICDGQFGCLPVVDEEGRLLGIVTETDLVRAAYLGPQAEGPVLDLDDARRGARKIGVRLEQELRSLEEARDELRLQLHLARADGRVLWQELEDKWRSTERKVGEIVREAKEPMHEVREAAEDALEELREGYRRFRKSLS